LTEEGERSRIGHLFWAVDPGALAGNELYLSRVEALIESLLQDPEVRLPGQRRHGLADAAIRDGIDIPASLHAQLQALAS
jgi:(2R)-3-sulfolactate dehydrogenase (NADP+)